MVQNWMETPDPENPGMFAGMTCTAAWDKGSDTASAVKVENYMNTTTLSDNTQPWNRGGWAPADK